MTMTNIMRLVQMKYVLRTPVIITIVIKITFFLIGGRNVDSVITDCFQTTLQDVCLSIKPCSLSIFMHPTLSLFLSSSRKHPLHAFMLSLSSTCPEYASKIKCCHTKTPMCMYIHTVKQTRHTLLSFFSYISSLI